MFLPIPTSQFSENSFVRWQYIVPNLFYFCMRINITEKQVSKVKKQNKKEKN